MRVREVTCLCALLLLVGVGACSTAVATGEMLDVTFQIDNNLPNIVGITAYVSTETGSRRSLGPVNSNERRAIPRSLRAGTYYLVAARVGAQDIVSERFRLDTTPIVVIWNVAQNQITIGSQ